MTVTGTIGRCSKGRTRLFVRRRRRRRRLKRWKIQCDSNARKSAGRTHTRLISLRPEVGRETIRKEG